MGQQTIKRKPLPPHRPFLVPSVWAPPRQRAKGLIFDFLDLRVEGGIFTFCHGTQDPLNLQLLFMTHKIDLGEGRTTKKTIRLIFCEQSDQKNISKGKTGGFPS